MAVRMFLSLRQVAKRFGGLTAVDRVGLDVEEGEFVCFLGPSGCGKTTLLRLIAGLELPDDGQIALRGRDLTGVPARQRNFGVVFQSYSLFPNMSVARNIAYGLECRKWKPEAVRARVGEMLALVHLTAHAAKYPHELSGGMQQRVALARALAPHPDALLLDEPLSALDAKVRETLRGEVRELQRALGITTIMVTHDQEEAMEMADRIVVMKDGAIEQIGDAHTLYHRPASRFVGEFIGRLNLLRLEADGNGRLNLAGQPLRLPVDAPASSLLVGIRPEEIRVLPSPADVDGDNVLSGTVEKVVFLGNVTRVSVDVAGQRVQLEVHGGAAALRPGGPVALALPAHALRVLEAG